MWFCSDSAFSVLSGIICPLVDFVFDALTLYVDSQLIALSFNSVYWEEHLITQSYYTVTTVCILSLIFELVFLATTAYLLATSELFENNLYFKDKILILIPNLIQATYFEKCPHLIPFTNIIFNFKNFQFPTYHDRTSLTLATCTYNT